MRPANHLAQHTVPAVAKKPGSGYWQPPTRAPNAYSSPPQKPPTGTAGNDTKHDQGDERMDGQSDIFDLLDDEPPMPAFTVYAGRSELCSWCNEKSYLTGGGIHHDHTDKSWGYAFCGPCKTQHGWPTPNQPITYQDKEGGG